jgi:hypothetical protein
MTIDFAALIYAYLLRCEKDKMKKIITILLLATIQTFLHADLAPSSGAGIAVRINVTSGTGFLASSGEALLFTDPESNEFILMGDESIDDATGIYNWNKTGENTASLILNDQISGFTASYEVTFSDQDTGSFSANVSGVGTQSGTFLFHYIIKPSEVSTTLGLSQPVVRVENNNVEIKLQMKSSTDLSEWINQSGSVSNNGTGELIFTSPVPTGNKFYMIQILDTP